MLRHFLRRFEAFLGSPAPIKGAMAGAITSLLASSFFAGLCVATHGVGEASEGAQWGWAILSFPTFLILKPFDIPDASHIVIFGLLFTLCSFINLALFGAAIGALVPRIARKLLGNRT